MAYALHIVTVAGDAPDLDTWKSAVANVEGVRLRTEPIEFVHPRDKQRVVIQSMDGDADVLMPSGDWVPVFQMGVGGVTFRAHPDVFEDDSHIRFVIKQLLAALGDVVVIGDEGEAHAFE